MSTDPLNDVRIHNLILASSLSSCAHDHHVGYMYRTYIFYIKILFLHRKTYKSINRLRPWTPIGGFAPGPHLGPGPHKARARCARRVFTFCASALNGAPNHPLPTGTHKQSYATACAKKWCFFRFLYFTESSPPSFKVRGVQMTMYLAFSVSTYQ